MLRPKSKCEICGLGPKEIIHYHHIIPQRDERCTNANNNIACLCPNCHSLVHAGEITIIGVYDTTGGLEVMFFKKGEEPPIPQQFWLVKDNPLVKRGNG